MIIGVRGQLSIATSIALAIIAATGVARAEGPRLAALAPADDARRAIALGPEGQVYEPDGSGAWVRTHGGGIAREIIAASVVGGTVVVGASGSPPFKLDGRSWTALHFGRKVKAILGAGSRTLAAVGRSVFTLDKLEPTKLADAPGAIRALAASGGSVVIATDGGLMKLAGSVFRPVPRCPKSVRALVSERWALVDRGVFDLKTLRTIALPADIQIVQATTVGNDLVGVSRLEAVVELVTIKGGKLAREPVPIRDPAPIVGVVADKQARVAIAMSDGRIALRDGGTWTINEVREQLPAPKPGPAPAKCPGPAPATSARPAPATLPGPPSATSAGPAPATSPGPAPTKSP
jgi:hypothetical protein